MKDNYGFFRVAAVSPRVRVADPAANTCEMARLARQASEFAPSVIVFPELCVTGYTCADLFGQTALLDASEKHIERFLSETSDLQSLLAFGAPVRFSSRLYNCAVIARRGKILGIVPKVYLPGNSEFYEPRNFESGASLGKTLQIVEFAGQSVPIGVLQMFRMGGVTLGVEVCQDLWVPIPPSTYAALSGAEVILNLTASNELAGKQDYRKDLLRITSARQMSAYVYCACGYGESTGDLVWAAPTLIYENGQHIASNTLFNDESSVVFADLDTESIDTARRKYVNYSRDGVLWADAWPFDGTGADYKVVDCGHEVQTDFMQKLFREVDPSPFVPGGEPQARDRRCREVFSIQTLGLMTRLAHTGLRHSVIGVSGGLDSTLALLVAAAAYDRLGWPRKDIVAVTMPGFGTSGRTRANAGIIMEELGVTSLEVPIVKACEQHFSDIGLDPTFHDATYENSQARERTQILMDLAGKYGGLVIGTGDLSELALGWCTYNGDHMSMYGVNADVPKTLVKELVRWCAARQEASKALCDALLDVVATPISPELVPGAQITEDIVGPYELHDFFLRAFFAGHKPEKMLLLARNAFEGRFDSDTLEKWLKVFLKRFFSQQFKRSCLPDGPKVGSVGLSPRGEWRMPSDASASVWTGETGF